MKNTPSKLEAIESSLQMIEAGKVTQWPQMIVLYCEQQNKGKALDFALQMYQELLQNRKHPLIRKELFTKWLKDFEYIRSGNSGRSASEIKNLSRDIWDNQQDQSTIKRGVTRLYDAYVFLAERNPSYIRSVMWALASLTFNSERLDVSSAKKIVARFSETYRNGRCRRSLGTKI